MSIMQAILAMLNRFDLGFLARRVNGPINIDLHFDRSCERGLCDEP